VGALITEKLQHAVDLEPGGRGEFSIAVDGKIVAQKTRTGFPGEAAILEQVRAALE
jgi:predicted Rdx family selenoprotein